MNIPNLSATPAASRELKPLHPFLRLVALFLAVALTFTGPVPMALAATSDTVTVTSGTLSITNLAQAGTALTVVAGGSFTEQTITLATGTITGGTLSLNSLIFSGTSLFQDKDVNLSVLSNLQLAAGGTLTLPNGMSISFGPISGVLLGGSAIINVGSSATQGGAVGSPGGEIRVDNVSSTRSTLTVNTGTSTADSLSAANLDLGTKLDLVKNGRGSLGLNLNSIDSVLNGGSLSIFSGTITVTAGNLLLGDNFLSDGTSNSLKITPVTSSTSLPVVVALQGYASVSSLLTSGGSASNVILGVDTTATSGQLVLNNAASDSSIFKGILSDAVDGTEGFQLYVVKNGNGSLLLSNADSSFTGGFTLNAGSLIVNASSTTAPDAYGTTVISGPLGGGALNLRGGTLFVPNVTTVYVSDVAYELPLSKVKLHNAAYFFASSDLDVASGGSLILERKVTFASANGTQTLTLAGVVDLDSGANVASGGSVTLVVNTPTEISGVITGDPSYGSLTGGSLALVSGGSGSMSLVKSGSAQLTLSGGNQYLGDFTVAQGTLLLGNAGALGIYDVDYQVAISMNSMRVLSGGVLDLGGITPVASVPLILSGTGAGSGALTNSGVELATSYSGSLTLAAASSIGGISDITLSGSVASAYNLTKLGTNTLTFGGTSAMSGSLIVSAGIAQIGTGGTFEFASTGGLVGDLVNLGVLRFNNSADRTMAGTISGTGSLVKAGAYNLTLSNGATYTGATTISAGSLTVKGALSTSQITNSGTFNWSPTTSVFTGSLSGSGKTLLTSTSAVTLTLGTPGSLGGNVQIGDKVTLSIGVGATLPGSITILSGGKLTLATGAGSAFGVTTTLTINSGGFVDLYGNTVNLGTLAMAANGGTLTSTGSSATLTFGTLTSGTVGIASSVIMPAFVVLAGTTFTAANGSLGYRLQVGSLGSLASGGSYSEIRLQPTGTGTLTVDAIVNAGTSVIASGTSGTLTLKVQAPVLTPLFDIQSGVNATFLSGGSLSSTGTLQIEGNVALSGQSLPFGNIALAGGSLSGGTLAAGLLTGTSGTVGTILGGSFGNITKTGNGILTITGSSTAYAGTLQVTGGTVKLGNSAALGSGRVSFAASSPDSVLQMFGNNLTLSSLDSGTVGAFVENGSSTAVILTVSPSASSSFSGGIRNGGAGGLSLVKAGAGDMTLSGSLTYTGGTTVSNGLLSLSGTTLPSGSLNVSGGSLDFGGQTQSTTLLNFTGGLLRNGTLIAPSYSFQTGTISAALAGGSAVLTKSGSGQVVLSGVNTYGGGTFVNGGTLTLGVNGALSSGSVSVTAGELALGVTSQTVGALTLSGGSITGGTLTATSIAAGTGTVTAILNGSGTFTKTGAGTVILNGANTLTGVMALQLGTVQLGGNGALTSGSLQISGALLDLGAATRSAGAVTLSSGSITNGTLNAASYSVQSGSIGAVLAGLGDFNKTGTTTVTLSGANTLSGIITVQSGTLALSGSGKLSSGSLIVSGTSTVTLGGGSQSVGAVTLNGGSIASGTLNGTSFAVQAGTVGAILAGSAAALTKSGSGQVVLNAANTYGGGTIVNAGTLTLGLNGALSNGSVSVTAGELGLGTTSQTVGAVTLSGGSITGGTLTASGFTVQGGSVASVLAGSGALTKDTTGLVILNAVNTLSGNVVISAGTLQLGTGQALASAGSVQITAGSLTFGSAVTAATLRSLAGNLTLSNSSGAAVALTLANNLDTTSAGVISGTGSLVKSGSGNLTLSGVNTYTGATSVTAGILTAGTGALDRTISITVNSAALNAADFNSNASLTINAAGSATIFNGGSYGAVSNLGSATFTTAGTVTLGSLSGSGVTQFSGSGVLNGAGVSAGTVSANSGRLQIATLSGGSASAVTLVLGTLSGGFASGASLSITSLTGGRASVTAAVTLTSMGGGSLELKGATATLLGNVSGGTVSLSNGLSGSASALSVSTGSFTGTLSGTGTLLKTGTGTFTLTPTTSDTIGVNVQLGTLNASNLFSGNRSITLGSGAQLGVTLTSGTYSGVLTAVDATSALKLSSSTPVTLTLGSGATLAGAVTLATSGITLNLASALTPFASNSSLTLVNGGTLALGSAEVDLSALTVSGGSLTISGSGGKLYYDTKPSFLTNENVLIAGTNVIVSGSVTFDTLTQGGSISTGTYQYSAGRVPGSSGTLFSGNQLLLDPKTAATTIRLIGGSFSQSIVAGGTSNRGIVSVDGLVYAGSYGNATGTTTLLSNGGTLLLVGSTTATPINNAGTLKISVTDSTKTVANLISGIGALEKIDGGLLVLSGSNTYSGTTTLSAGILNMGGSLALGTGGANSIVFKGGTLQYGFSGDGTDLSNRIANSTTGNNVAIDTNGNNVSFGSALGGTGGLLKAGSGNLTLNAGNTFSGAVSMQGGTLELAAAGSLSAASVNVGSLGLLRFSRSDATSFAGGLTGAGAAEMVGSGALTLGGSWTGYTGTFSLSAGTLVLGSASALTGGGTLAFKGGLLQYGTSVTTDISARFAALNNGSLLVDTNSNNVVFAGSLTGTGGLVKSGSGNLTLSGTNAFSGVTAVNAGSLITLAGALNNTSAILVSGATLNAVNYNQNATLSVDATGRATVSSSGTYGNVNNEGSATFSGGTVTLGGLSGAGATSFVGNARINAGSISAGRVAAGGSLQSNVEGGTVTAASLFAGTLSGGSVTVTGAASANLISGGVVTVGGSATLGLVGGGNLALNGALASIGTFTGGTVAVNNGTLTVNAGLSGSVISGNGSFVKDSGSLLTFNTSGGLAVTGSVTVKAGTLSVVDLYSASPLTVSGGSLLVSGSGLSLGVLSNSSFAGFTAQSGTITLAGLTGGGVTALSGNATIVGGSISAGTVNVTNNLKADVSGGMVTVSGVANANLVSGGSLTVSGSATLGVVSGGNLSLNGALASIGTFNGVSPKVFLADGSTLTVNEGISSGGSISGSGAFLVKAGNDTLTLNSALTGYVTVNAGTLSAVNFAQNSLLTVTAGKLIVSGSGLTLGTLSNSSVAVFSGTSGTITLGSLNGSGTTTFASNAIINSPEINNGIITANSGRLQITTLNGGSVSASNLVLGALTSGQATATSAGSIATMTAGSLTLTGGVVTVGNLTGGAIALSNAATVSVSTGSYAGSLIGTGTLAKTGTGTFELNSTLSPNVSVNILAGSLNSMDLLSGSLTVAVNTGAQLNLLLGTLNSTYSGILSGAGSTMISTTLSASTLRLSATGKLDGALNFDTGLTLNLALAASNPFGNNASLSFKDQDTLILGGSSQRLELRSVSVASNGTLYLQGGGVVYYDTKPTFLNGYVGDIVTLTSGTLVTFGSQSLSVSGGSVTFDILTKGGTFGSSGSYQYTAGRVQLTGGVPVVGTVLLLDPAASTTTLRLSGGSFSTGIIAGGTGATGAVSFEGLVLAESYSAKNSGIVTILTQGGTLQTSSGNATPIANSGTLQISVIDGSKTVRNLISGSGSLEKIDAGTLVLSGTNTYSGPTILSAGILNMGGSLVLGTGTAASIVFKGGALQYGYNSGVTDLSSRIASSTSGNNVAIDTNGYNVAFANGIAGGGGFVKTGAGSLTLSGNNTFLETALIQQGTLEVTAGSFAAGVDVAGGSLLRFNRSDVSTYGGSLSGAGVIEKVGSGILTLTGADTGYTGTLNLSTGTLEAGSSLALSHGTLAFKGGILRYATGVTTDVSTRVAALSSGDAKFDTNGNDVSFATGFTGAGGLTKLGSGSLTLNGTSSYRGATTVNAGTLSATVSGALASTVSLEVKGGATLNAVNFNSSAAVAIDISGRAIVSGTGLSLGAVSNAGSLSFTAEAGTVSLTSLLGTGATDFAADAVIQSSGVTQGRVTVAGSLQALIAGGSVTAGTLFSGSVTGGTVTVSRGIASLGTVSGGSLTLLGATSTIATLNGGSVALGDSSVLTVQAGISGGVISGSGSLVKEGVGTLNLNSGLSLLTGNITVSAGTLSAANYSASSLLTVGSSGQMNVNSSNLVLGTLFNRNVASFTSNSGTITLGSLNGSGTTTFASSAIINSPEMNDGIITANSGRLQIGTLNGGAVSAQSLVLTTLRDGQATAGSLAAVTSLIGGTLNLNSALATVGTLTAGNINLASSDLAGSGAKLTATTGNFSGVLAGTGTFVKSGTGTSLTLNTTPSETVGVSVLGGSLFAGNLLTGSRAVSVNSAAYLNLTLVSGTYNGKLTGSGTTSLTSSGASTLAFGSLASLDGALKLDATNLTLNLSAGDTNKFGSNASLTLLSSGTLILGGSLQELELNSINIVSGGSLYLTGSGGKILYDEKPAFLTGAGETFTLTSGTSSALASNGTSSVYVTSGSVTFDVLTQGTLLPGNAIGGTYQYTAGRVQLKGGTQLNASQLLLDPKLPTTTIRMSGGTISGAIVVGGTSHQGTLSVDGLITAEGLSVADSGVTVKITQAGSLQTSSGGATSITNGGTLQFSVTDGSKAAANLISGSGSVEKVDGGTLTLSAKNTYTGKTLLSGGVLVLDNVNSFGSGTLMFQGGALRYGSGITVDLSSRIGRLVSDIDAMVDTNGNSVTFDTGLTGSGGLKKSGNGTLVLSGSNTFNGALKVAAGTVQLGSGVKGLFSSAAEVDSGALLRFSRTDNVTYSGALSGSGTVEKTEASTLTLSGAGSFGGTVNLSGGVLVFGNSLALGETGSLSFNGGGFQYGQDMNRDLSGQINTIASGKIAIIDTGTNDVSFGKALNGAGGFTKLGSGELTFKEINSYTGPTTVKYGSVVYDGVSSGTVVLTSGTVKYNLNGQSLSGNVAAAAGTSVYLNNAGTYNGVVSGLGDLYKSGAGEILLNNSQLSSGSLKISAGSLTLGATAGLNNGIINIANGATLNALNGSLNSRSSLSLGDASTLSLGGVTMSITNFTLSGGTVTSSDIDGATILVSGTIVINGTARPSYEVGNVSISKVSAGSNGFTSLTSGTLKGSIGGGTFNSLSADVATNLKIMSSDVAIIGGVNIGSGSVTLSKTLSADSVNIGSGSGNTSVTIGAGGGIKSDSVTFSGTLNLGGSIGASTEGGGSVVFGGTSNAGGSATVTLNSGATITAKTVSFNSGSLVMSGSIASAGGDVSFGSSTTGGTVAAAVTLSGSAKITAEKVKLTGGSNLTLDLDAVKALDGVKSLEVGGKGSSGTLTINSGTTYTVAPGNTLKGSGTIVGKIAIGAGSVLSPGNSPGTLNVGTATVASGGVIVLEHGNGTNVDNVTGTSLDLQAGSTINIVDYERSLLGGTAAYNPFAGIAILNGTSTAVTISVRLGNDTGVPGDTGVSYTTAVSALYSGSYNITTRTISVTHSSAASLGNFSGNTLTAANAIDARLLALAGTFSVSGVDEIGTGATATLALANLPAQLAAANPAGYAELAGLSTQRMLTLNQGIVGHFSSMRAGLIEIQDQALSGWLSTYGTWQKQNGDSNQGTAGFSGNTWGSLFGVEQRRGDLTFGLTGATGQTTANFQALTGHLTTDAWHAGVYAVARMGDVVLESSALLGMTETTARRTISASGLTSREGRLSVNGTEWLLNTGAALPLIAPGSLTITPSARLIVQGQMLDASKESDLAGLEVALAKQSTASVLHQAGVEIRKQMSLMGKSAAATLQTDWIHNYNAKGRDLNMAMGGGSTSYGYKGSDAGADAIRMTGAFEAALNERTTLRLSVDYQTQSRATSTNGSVSLGYAF